MTPARKYLFLLLWLFFLSMFSTVSAYQQDFQNYDGDLLVSTTGLTNNFTLQAYRYNTTISLPDLIYYNGQSNVYTIIYRAGVFYNTQQAASYWSIVLNATNIIDGATYNHPYALFRDASGNTLLEFTGFTTTSEEITTDWERWDYSFVGGNILVYKNGEYQGNAGAVAIAPSYFIGGYCVGEYQFAPPLPKEWKVTIDDYIIRPTSTAQFNIVESLPNTHYIILDSVNPANNGLYYNGVLKNSNFYWNKIDTVSNATKLEQVVNVNTGTVYDSLWVSRCVNETQWNISVLAAAGAPTGLYKFQWDEPGYGLHTSDSFWLTTGGSNVVWSSHLYAIGSSSTISWNIVASYWDPATYSYQGRIVDAYGVVKKTWVISTQTGSESTTLDSTTYSNGVYFAEVQATQLASPYTVYSLGYDYTEIYTDMIIVGTTYDASAGILLPSIDVNITQSGMVYHRMSTNPGSIYNKTGLAPSLLINLSASGKNSTGVKKMHVPVWFTPLAYGTYTINMYLTDDPNNQTHQGDAIYGLVQSTPYYAAVGGATVNLWNATFGPVTATTNATGFYIFNFTAAYETYFMNATAPGYTNTTLHLASSPQPYTGIVYNATREDFLLSSMYTMTIHFVDSQTGIAIPNVTVIDSNGYSQTTGTGTFTYYYPYSLVIFYFSADGYVSSSVSYVIDSDKTVTVSLTAVEATTPVTWYTPKTVSFRIVDVYGNPLVGANVNATYNSTTLPKGVSDLINNYGMNTQAANDALNGTLFMNGLTDSSGSIVFTMMSSIMYDIVVTYGGSNNTYRMYPQESIYQLKFIATTPVDNVYDALFAAGNTKVWATEPDLYNVTLWWQYQDVSGKTTRIDYYLFDVDTGTIIFTTNVTAPVSGGIYQVNFTLPNVRGKNYMWWTNYSRNI